VPAQPGGNFACGMYSKVVVEGGEICSVISLRNDDVAHCGDNQVDGGRCHKTL